MTASMTASSLSPSQQAAREFWRQTGADGMPPFYIMSQYYAQLASNSDNLPVVTAAIEQLLTGLAYDTDVDTVFSEFDGGKGEELGYWAGRYCLFDSDGNRFDLVVGRDGATLTVPPALVNVESLPAGADLSTLTVLSGASFSQGVLSLTNAQFQVSLTFAVPVSDATFDSADSAAAMFQATAPQCKGTFAVVGANAGTRSVNGKRGSWTQAGVNQDADGDPASAWYGQYVLLDLTDVTAVAQVPDPVYIYNDPNFGLTFQWGASTYGSNVTYNNNVLLCANEDDDTIQYAVQFVSPQAGAAEFSLAVSTAGVLRSYRGFWVADYQPAAVSALLASGRAMERLAKRPMTAVLSSGAPGNGYSQSIDVSELKAGATTKIMLPSGAVGYNYSLSLNLINYADTDTFSWQLKPGTGKNDATSRAAIALGGGANQTVLFSFANLSDSDLSQQLLVTVQLTRTSAATKNSAATQVSYMLQFDILAVKCNAISLAPTVLMPLVVGTAFTQNLVAHGANDSFTWSVDTSSLPPGLTWNADSHQLSGTVTDAAQVGKAFSLVVVLAAPDVIMDPLTVSIGITVQSAPVVASDMSPWEKIFISSMAASGLVMALIAAFAINRIKAAKANAKTGEVVTSGDNIVNNATNNNPEAVAKVVLENELKQRQTAQQGISVARDVLDQLADKQNTLNQQIVENQKLYEGLKEYLEKNPGAPLDAEIKDPVLNEAGYNEIRDIEPGLKKLDTQFDGLVADLKASIQNYTSLSAKNTADQDKTNAGTASSENDSKLNDLPIDSI